jgi:RNA polymerase sigma-B factor
MHSSAVRVRGNHWTEADDRAVALINALVACSPDDPSRALLRDEAIAAWLPMVRRLARRYAGRGEALEDLVQTATIGLINAVDRFDPAQGTDFVGYAFPTILGEIKRYFRDRAWSVRVPRRLQEMRTAINDATTVLTQSLGRPPTVVDVAAYLQVGEERVIEGLEGARAYRAMSLSLAVGGGDGAVELGELLGSDEKGYEVIEWHLALGPALARLTPRQRRIVTLRFYGNQTQSQIAAQVGMSQMHVSRQLTKALATLRTDLDPDACG